METPEASFVLHTCGSHESFVNELVYENPACSSSGTDTLTWTPDDSTPNMVYYQVGLMPAPLNFTRSIIISQLK